MRNYCLRSGSGELFEQGFLYAEPRTLNTLPVPRRHAFLPEELLRPVTSLTIPVLRFQKRSRLAAFDKFGDARTRAIKHKDGIQEIALRVVIELPGWEFRIMGTAVLIAGHLAITAGHEVDQALKQFGMACELVLIQVLPGRAYRLWNVSQGWRCSTDIALLQLASPPGSIVPARWNWSGKYHGSKCRRR